MVLIIDYKDLLVCETNNKIDNGSNLRPISFTRGVNNSKEEEENKSSVFIQISNIV